MTDVDWHGIERRYRCGDRYARRLRELVPAGEWLDREGVLAAWGERHAPAATIVRGVERVLGPMVGASVDRPLAAARAGAGDGSVDRTPTGARGPAVGPTDRTSGPVADGPVEAAIEAELAPVGLDRATVLWRAAFESAIAMIAATARNPVIALGGGLDGAAILAIWCSGGGPKPTCATISTGIAGYDEVDEARAIAARYGCRCDVIEMSVDDIVDAIPEAAAVGETPLYNLHPVTRLALARELARRGHDTLVTGDGGDAVFAGVPDHDYVPIVAAYTRTYLAHASPYLDPIVTRFSIEVGAKHPDRAILRKLVGDDRPKRPRMLPAIALDRIADRRRIESLARSLDLPPAIDARWVTLDYLVRHLEARQA